MPWLQVPLLRSRLLRPQEEAVVGVEVVRCQKRPLQLHQRQRQEEHLLHRQLRVLRCCHAQLLLANGGHSSATAGSRPRPRVGM